MASLRNAVPNRPYRERDQPNARTRHGLLEKHKDYSARARDYNAKKARLKILREKASNKNEDEFHFGMMSSKSNQGVKIAERGSKSLSNDVVKLLKTQDAGYLRMMVSQTRSEKKNLESAIQIHDTGPRGETNLRILKDGGKTGKHGGHTVFVDDEAQQEEFNIEHWCQTQKEESSPVHFQSKGLSDTIEDTDHSPIADKKRRTRAKVRTDGQEALKRRHKRFDQMSAKLKALQTREQALQEAIESLDLQRARMNNSVGGVNKKGVKFKVRERKK